jgi:hypothetical protein
MINWRYTETGRTHGTKDKRRLQPNYTPSPVYRYVWEKPTEKDDVNNGEEKQIG